MSKKLVYLSTEWKEEAEKRLKRELTSEKLKGLSSTVANIHLNCPDGKKRFIYSRYEKGELVDFLVGEGDSIKAEFVISGEYDTYVGIFKEEISTRDAFSSGKIKFKGNMIKAIKLVPIAAKVNRILGSITTKYGNSGEYGT